MDLHSKRAAAWLAFIGTLQCTLLLNAQTASKSHNFETFSDYSGGKLNHLAVDHFRGWVYVGGVNRIYQLNPSLELFSNFTTGPVDDAPECSFHDCPPNISRKPTDNHNKVLVIDYSTSRLIICGSTLQGMCTIHSLENISKVLQEVKEPVVANNATASTVAFIAHGPSQSSSSPSSVLYVGVTYTGNSAYRFEVPAVASRSLDPDRMLTIASVGVNTGTKVFLDTLSRERYIINYVFGFSSGSFSYFLTTQMKSPSSATPYISKLVRICHDDKDYYSYTEIPIECIGEGGRSYNLAQAAYVRKPAGGNKVQDDDDVLFVIFSQSETNEGERANKPSKNCALCIYPLKNIKRQFHVNINNCFKGKGSRGLDFIKLDEKCIRTNINIITEDFCGLDLNSPLGGEIPVTINAALTFNTQLTSVAATSIDAYTVVFIGTKNGHLKKLVVKSDVQAIEYSDLAIDEGSAVNTDMVFDATMNYLYVMTEHRVTKVKVQDCNKYESFWQCLDAKDPYCGWCSLENKCTMRNNCQFMGGDSSSWISCETGKCISITSATPKELQLKISRTLKLAISNLPQLTGQFLCVFSILDKTLITNATRNDHGVNCTTPRTDLLPSIPPGHHNFTAKLSVKTSDSPVFVGTNFTFFDCQTFTSCTSCVSSNFPCDWCVNGHRCTHDTAENCHNDILVTGLNRGGPSYRSGPTSCPTINATTDGSTEILVPAGTKNGIRVKIHIIDEFIVQTRFLCQFNIEGRVYSVNADLIGDIIYCERMEFQYTQKGPNMTATFAVIWGGSKPLDNPDKIHVMIYRCRDMADNCGMCLASDKKYSCGWCQSTNRCEIIGQCDSGSGGWLDQNHTCLNPSITSFKPQLGPWEGGTNITIQGINLGRSYEDVYGGITVSGISCEPYRHLYKPTREIVCRVNGSGTSEPRKGPVVVKIDNFRGESKQVYQFVDPKIESIFPRRGPRAGGTLLSVQGEYMNAGSNIEVSIDELPCHTLKVDPDEVQCITSSSDRLRKGKITVKFDQQNRLYDQGTYEYTEDPTLEHMESGGNSFNRVPKGIPAGGVKLSVTGKHLLSIQKPHFYVYDEEKTQRYSSKCEVHSDSLMTCHSPYIPDISSSTLDPENPKLLHYGFEMDNVTSVQNISAKPYWPLFSLYPNPTFDTFPKSIKNYCGDYLTIDGKNIDRACQESDVIVQIGKSYCYVTSLSKKQLTCRLPETQPPGATNSSEPEINVTEPPEVVVSIGENFKVNIGQLSYP